MLDKLKRLGACREAVSWVESQQNKTAQELWDSCPDGSWLLWLLGITKTDPKKIVLCAARCARLSLQYNDDPRVIAAIETAEAFANDKATVEDCRKASAAARAAARADDAAAAAATAAAVATYAAANAVNVYVYAYAAVVTAADAAAAAYVAADDAVAADASAAAAAGVAYAAATYAAHATTLKQCADIVRELFPDVPVI